MSEDVKALQRWFEKLSRSRQEEVLEFLYGGEALLREGLYCGPFPHLVQKGLHCGPAPAVMTPSSSGRRVCPTCGRPL